MYILHFSSWYFTFNNIFSRYINSFICQENGRQCVVVPKASSSKEGSWLGLAKFAWSGFVLECQKCGVIYRYIEFIEYIAYMCTVYKNSSTLCTALCRNPGTYWFNAIFFTLISSFGPQSHTNQHTKQGISKAEGWGQHVFWPKAHVPEVSFTDAGWPVIHDPLTFGIL